ncbi:MAG: 2-amino-4-hydroxy-6-hydroxymethyldihydropteridine diphosphokinase [Muribaculaceae bacterium]|nr:2-amino-4-hydroxy-6-hydroxymethyldihydropteridine diphosphokinase [Muribaculaceae bacterium]
MIAHINIGSNIGDRLGAISRAVARVLSLSDLKTGRFSPPVGSHPLGFNSPNDFINIGVEIATSLSPFELLDALQTIERQISPDPHRDRQGNYVDRLIDIDIIYIDDLVIDTPQLQIPHPRMSARDFVLRPLNFLSPGWIHPVYKISANQMLQKLNSII